MLAAACWLAPQAAEASGYAVREASADAMGSAYAGSAATADDASYMAFNPAALGSARGFDIAESLAGISADTSSHYSATTASIPPTPTGGPDSPGEFVSRAAVPALAVRWRLDDRWAVGLSLTSPWGLNTNYPANWVGRYYIIYSQLKTFDIAPLVSFRITPRIDIAAGPQIQYASGGSSSAIDVGTLAAVSGGTPAGDDIRARFKALGWGFGWTIGARAQLSDALSVGISWRAPIAIKAKGQLTFDGVSGNPFALGIGIFNDGPASAKLTTPAMVSMGARWHVRDRWTVLGEADWTGWHVFRSLQIESPDPALSDFTAMNWKDTWFFALGAEYALDDRWTLKGGTAFDESPVPSSTRSPRIADSDRTWLTLGARYRAWHAIDLSVSYAHLFSPRATIDLHQTDPGSALKGNISGTSDSSTNIIAVQLNYHPA